MTEKQSNLFRIILFAAGLGIMLLAFFLFRSPVMAAVEIFMWINIAVCYLVFFIPFFFGAIHLKGLAAATSSYVIIWISDLIFVVCAVSFCVLVPLKLVEIRLAVLTEAVLFFVAIILVYFAVFTGSHIKSVKQNETHAMASIKQIRSSMETLSFKATSLGDGYGEEKKTLEALTEEVKYISPVKDIMGAKFEQES